MLPSLGTRGRAGRAASLVPVLACACSNAPPAPGPPQLDPDPPVLGTVAGASSTACPAGVPAGASCTGVTVTCPKLDDLGAVVAVTEPSGPIVGTVYLHNNLGGVAVFDYGFAAAYLAAGLRVVQPVWRSDWQTGQIGLKHAACRYATLVAWAFQEIHGADRTKGFCAQGFGAGSGGLTYALAQYGAGDVLDAVTVSAGPPFARVDLGCSPGTPPRPACPEISAAPVAYSGAVLTVISTWEVAPSCGSPNPPAAEVVRWQADSVLSTGAVTSFPKTSLAAWYCVNAPDGTVGQGSLFFDAVDTDKAVHCVTAGAAGGSCTGETPWPSALPDMAADLVARCVPRH
jgi:hypothetical protein